VRSRSPTRAAIARSPRGLRREILGGSDGGRRSVGVRQRVTSQSSAALRFASVSSAGGEALQDQVGSVAFPGSSSPRRAGERLATSRWSVGERGQDRGGEGRGRAQRARRDPLDRRAPLLQRARPDRFELARAPGDEALRRLAARPLERDQAREDRRECGGDVGRQLGQ
jgi:hypothetical protein